MPVMSDMTRVGGQQQHRPTRVAGGFLRHAAQREAPETAPSMRAQHDQIDVGILARGDDLIGHPFANRLNRSNSIVAKSTFELVNPSAICMRWSGVSGPPTGASALNRTASATDG